MRLSTIYKINNNITNKCYIGSTSNLKKRISQHFSNLNKKKHSNIHLQSSYDIYGKDSFEVIILVNCPIEYQFKLEQWFIDNIKPEYNLSKFAIFTQQLPETKDTRLNKRKGQLKRWEDKAQRQNVSSYLKDRWNNNVEYTNKMKSINSLENHPQSTITNNIARLIKEDIENKVKRKITLDKYKISVNIYKDIKRGKTWKTI